MRSLPPYIWQSGNSESDTIATSTEAVAWLDGNERNNNLRLEIVVQTLGVVATVEPDAANGPQSGKD